MSEQLNELGTYDFPDTEMVPEGYDMTTVVKMSDRNFRILVDEHNKLVRKVNELVDE